MSDRILLKLGGSVITDKKGDCAINHDQLSSVASAISRASPSGLVIIHGAGSCGHHEAKNYRLDTGAVAGKTDGIYITHRAVSRLNNAVVVPFASMVLPPWEFTRSIQPWRIRAGSLPLNTGIWKKC